MKGSCAIVLLGWNVLLGSLGVSWAESKVEYRIDYAIVAIEWRYRVRRLRNLG